MNNDIIRNNASQESKLGCLHNSALHKKAERSFTKYMGNFKDLSFQKYISEIHYEM